MSRCAVCLAATAVSDRPSSSVPTNYTLRINNRHRRRREQTAPSMHRSIDQTSHALQSALIVCVHLTECSSISSRASERASTWCGQCMGACNQLATAGQFVIATQPPAPPAGSVDQPPARWPALIHSKCIDRREKVGKVRDTGDKWQTA